MALWDKPSAPQNPSGGPAAATTAGAATVPPPTPASQTPASFESSRLPKERVEMKESVIAAGLSIEGKIVGSGHVRVAGKFKGDIQVEGNLHIDAGAKVEGQVRAGEVIVSGDLQGNIESAKRVELQQGGTITGDVKAGSLTVASGSRMRGTVEFGWEDSGSAAGSARTTPAPAPAPAAIHGDKGRSNVA